MNLNYLMMIQLAGIHNGFHNKNHQDNIDIADIGNMDNNMGNNMGNTEAVGEHTEVAGEHTEVAGEHTEVVEEHTEAAGEHTEVAGEHTEVAEEYIAYHNIVVDNRQLAVLLLHWQYLQWSG